MNLKLKDGSPVILVGAGSDDSDFSTTSFAVVTFTQELFDKIVNLRLGREIAEAYEITKFSYECEWLSEYEFAEDRDEKMMTDEEIVSLEEFAEDCAGVWQIEPTGDVAVINDDCAIIHVNDFGIRFTALIKHTNTKIYTERIPYDLIYRLKF